MLQRTTLRLDPELLRAAKKRAAEEGITLTAHIERALPESTTTIRPKRRRVRLVRVEGAVQPGLDLEDRATLLGLMHEESPTFDGGAPYPGMNLERNADVLERMDEAL
jgi:hypothetical protein